MTTEHTRSPASAAVAPDYTPTERRRILSAACLGWGMEYFDFMLPTLLATQIMKAYGVSAGVFSIAIVGQLIGSAVGGLAFGWLGDRFGRRRTPDVVDPHLLDRHRLGFPRPELRRVRRAADPHGRRHRG